MILYPKAYFKKVEQITAQYLRQNNIKALILDVDNTLIDYNKNLSEDIIDWSNTLKGQGVKLYILSSANTSPIFATRRGNNYEKNYYERSYC